MEKIDIRCTKRITKCTYSTDKIHNLDSACEWIVEVCDMPNLVVDHITLKDLGERNEDGNTTKRIKGKISLCELKRQIKEVALDKITVSGEYKNKNIIIGVNVRNYTTSISMHNADAALIEEVQQYL